MALKDWKKVKEIFRGVRIYSYRNIRNYKQIYVHKSFNEWMFTVSKGEAFDYSDKDTKIFKSKIQALKFAKSYMRKH